MVAQSSLGTLSVVGWKCCGMPCPYNFPSHTCRPCQTGCVGSICLWRRMDCCLNSCSRSASWLHCSTGQQKRLKHPHCTCVSCVMCHVCMRMLCANLPNWLLFNECRCVCTLPSGPSYVVWLLCCRKQVGGQIPVHLASQMKPQQWTEMVEWCFQKVKELSALEAKRKFIGNPPLVQTMPCPSCGLLSLSPSSSPSTADIISSFPLYGSRFFPATVGNCAHAQPVHVTALLVHFLLVCISFLCRV